MKANTNTPVIFRKWAKLLKGDGIIALFPSEPGTNDPYTCDSYQHIDQHGSANPQAVIHITEPAKPEEYADLLKELKSIGYDDLVVYQHFQQRFFKMQGRYKNS